MCAIFPLRPLCLALNGGAARGFFVFFSLPLSFFILAFPVSSFFNPLVRQICFFACDNYCIFRRLDPYGSQAWGRLHA